MKQDLSMEKPSARNFGAAWNRELLHACKFIDSVLGMTMAAWGYITPLTHGDMYRGGATGESGRFANVSCVFSCSNRMALWLKKKHAREPMRTLLLVPCA